MMQSSDESPVATRGDLPMLNYGMSVNPKATWIRRATVAAVVLAGLATAYILIGPAARRVWRRAGERSQQREAMVYALFLPK